MIHRLVIFTYFIRIFPYSDDFHPLFIFKNRICFYLVLSNCLTFEMNHSILQKEQKAYISEVMILT